MTLVDDLNRKYPHPTTLVFDDTVLIEIASLTAVLFIGIVGLVFFWPMAALGFGAFAVFGFFAWKDFGKHFFESLDYRHFL